MRSACYFRFENDFQDIELIILRDADFSYPLHNHSSTFVLGGVSCGEISLTKKKHLFNLGVNDLFAISPREPHAISAKGLFGTVALCIPVALLSQAERLGSLKLLREVLKRTIMLAKMPLLSVENRLLTELLAPKAWSDFPCRAFEELEHAKKRSDPIEHARQIIRENPEKTLGIEEMAREAGMSLFGFIRAFERQVGLTPYRYRLQNQIRRAQRMLATSGPITEVALESGFYDQSHFIRHFKKILGLAPRDYRRSLQNYGAEQKNLANNLRPSAPALTSWGTLADSTDTTPGS